jgi:hypothetical protein
MKKPFLTILVFVGVFLCGGVVGGALSVHYYERFVRNKGTDRFFDREMRDLGEKLDLTAQQKKELRTIFVRAMADQRAAKKQADVIIDRMVADFEAVLTPEQLAKFKEHRAKQRAAREQQMRERERRGGPQGPEGGKPSPFLMERREREHSPNTPARPEGPPPPPETAGSPDETKPAP